MNVVLRYFLLSCRPRETATLIPRLRGAFLGKHPRGKFEAQVIFWLESLGFERVRVFKD